MTTTKTEAHQTKNRKWLTELPEKIVQRVFSELIRHAEPVAQLPQEFNSRARRRMGALRPTSGVRLYWLRDSRAAVGALATTFPKNILQRLAIVDGKNRWILSGEPLLAAIAEGDRIEAVVVCSEVHGRWHENVICPERASALLLREHLLEQVPHNERLFVADDLLTMIQLETMGLAVLGMLGNWAVPYERLCDRNLAVAVKLSASSGRPLSTAGSKLKRANISFEEVDRDQLEVSWILHNAQAELGALRPRFWQATIGKFLGTIRRGVLRLATN